MTYKRFDKRIYTLTNEAVEMKLPEFDNFTTRLNTFLNWSGPNAIHMAGAGFVYIGPGDLVQCYHCGLKLKSWKTFHSPYFEHEQWSKTCPCVKSQASETTGPGH